MEIQFTGDIWFWKGPAPFHFVRLPPEASQAIREVRSAVAYGWGMIPVEVQIGATCWRTSLFPKDGSYLLPLKDQVRHAEGLELEQIVSVRLTAIRSSS